MKSGMSNGLGGDAKIAAGNGNQIGGSLVLYSGRIVIQVGAFNSTLAVGMTHIQALLASKVEMGWKSALFSFQQANHPVATVAL